MEANREINALLHLIDDPDEEVYDTVHQRLLSLGAPVIPNLESLWENTVSEAVQGRIEMIIHRIHFAQLYREMEQWLHDETDLLHGLLLVSKYQYPDLQSLKTLQEIERMRRNLWLEMNSFLTPVEQVKIMETILYRYYKVQGGEIDYSKPDSFLLHKLVESKKGNALSTSLLYLVLAEMLDLPVQAIRIPGQFILGYFTHAGTSPVPYDGSIPAASKIKFFIDPNSGVAFSHQDLLQYFSRIRVAPVNAHFKPVSHTALVKTLVLELANCFQTDATAYKKQELQELAALLQG